MTENFERGFIAWKTSQTGTANARDFEDGRRNVGTFNANHPASNFCQTLSLNSFTDWHLPANWELWAMESAKINTIPIPGVTMGTILLPTFFWSSMEDAVIPVNATQIAFNGNPDFFSFPGSRIRWPSMTV